VSPRLHLLPAKPGLACQKLIDRHYGSIRLGREKCLRPAVECEVWRAAFSCRATLCEKHRSLAEKQGYTVKARAA